MTHARAERLGQRFGVHRATIYRYQSRLAEVDEDTAIAGRTRGWKPLASRLSAKQEQGVEEAINALRKKPGPLRVVDLVEEVAARCRLLRVPCPSRPAIDRPSLRGRSGHAIAAPTLSRASSVEERNNCEFKPVLHRAERWPFWKAIS